MCTYLLQSKKKIMCTWVYFSKLQNWYLSTNFCFPNLFALINVHIFVFLNLFYRTSIQIVLQICCFWCYCAWESKSDNGDCASVVGCWIDVTYSDKEEVLIINFGIGYNLAVIVCDKLYCFFSKMITWHLFIGVLDWRRTLLLRHDWT